VLLRSATAMLAGFILIDGGAAAFIYQCSYDPSLACCSPGTILRQFVETDEAGRGKSVLDFGPGDEAYKAGVCDSSMRLLRIINPLQPSGVALAMVLRARLALKRRVKSLPALYGAICRAHRLGAALREGMPSRSGFRRNPETLEAA